MPDLVAGRHAAPCMGWRVWYVGLHATLKAPQAVPPHRHYYTTYQIIAEAWARPWFIDVLFGIKHPIKPFY